MLKSTPPRTSDGTMLKKIVHPHPALQFTQSLPYGAILHDDGVQFVVFSRSATAMRLLLYDKVDDREPAEIIDFDRDTDRWGDIWSIFVPGLRRRPALSLSGRRPVRSRARPVVRRPRPADRSVCQGPGRRFLCRRRRHRSARPSAWWSMTTSIGKATATSGAASPRRSSTRCTSAASPATRPAASSTPARTWA